MVNLELYLGQDEQLLKSYNEIQDACRRVWKNVRLPWFTDHTPAHSARLVKLLNKILSPLEGTSYFPTKDECFVLLASCYLHDIGMQDLRVGDKPIETLTEEDFTNIRKQHAQRTFDLIREGVLRPEGPDSVDLRVEGFDGWARAFMWVCKAHSTEYFDGVVSYLGDDPLRVNDEVLRGEFLCALLMLADELDLPRARADFEEAKLLKLSTESQLHWFTHYYTTMVDVSDQVITVHYRFPEDSADYAFLLEQRVSQKLEDQTGRCNAILSAATGGLLNLRVGEPMAKPDIEGLKRKMPPEVIALLQKSAMPPASDEPSGAEVVAALTDYTPQMPTPLFTGREDELEELEKKVTRFPVSMVEGIGGTGKTELVAEYIRRQERYPSPEVLWFDLSKKQSIDDIAVALGRKEMLGAEKMAPRQKGISVSSLVEQAQTLVVIDNAQEASDAALGEMLKHAVKHMKQSRILLVGKGRAGILQEIERDLGILPINGLKDKGIEYARRLRDTRDVSITDDELRTICRDVDNHPLAIYVAFQILRYGQSPDNLIQKIVEFSSEEKASEELSKRLLGVLHEQATVPQRGLAYRLSVFRKPFARNAAEFVSSAANWGPDFNVLVDKLMLRPEGRLFSMHALVAAFCQGELKDATGANAGAAEYYKALRKDKPDITIESEIVHHLLQAGKQEEAAGTLLANGEDFLIWGHTSALLDIFADVESSQAMTDRLRNLRARLYTEIGALGLAYPDLAISERSDDAEVRAEAKYRLAMIRLDQNDLAEANRLLQESLCLARSAGVPRLVAYNLDGQGRYERMQGRLPRALALHQQAYDVLAASPSARPSDLAAAINGTGMVLRQQGKLDQALKKFEDSLAIDQKSGYRVGIAVSLNNIAFVLAAQGTSEKAIADWQESISISREIGTEGTLFTSLRNLGDHLVLISQTQPGVEALMEADAIARRLEIEAEIDKAMGSMFTARDEIGYQRFRKFAEAAFQRLPAELKPYSAYGTYVADQTEHRDTPKVGRNDPCPCGSGLKYKKCHGAA